MRYTGRRPLAYSGDPYQLALRVRDGWARFRIGRIVVLILILIGRFGVIALVFLRLRLTLHIGSQSGVLNWRRQCPARLFRKLISWIPPQKFLKNFIRMLLVVQVVLVDFTDTIQRTETCFTAGILAAKKLVFLNCRLQDRPILEPSPHFFQESCDRNYTGV